MNLNILSSIPLMFANAIINVHFTTATNSVQINGKSNKYICLVPMYKIKKAKEILQDYPSVIYWDRNRKNTNIHIFINMNDSMIGICSIPYSITIKSFKEHYNA